jgi:tetratricopeptide (TPR) repeat protein
MRRIALTLLTALTLAACGAGGDDAARADLQLTALFAQLEQADSPDAAAPVERAIWTHWADSGSPTVNTLLERASAAAAAGDSDLANRFIDEAVDLAPQYAEPWNRRAEIAYQGEDYAGAIAAIQETLRREPRHFGAMTALGIVYEELGQERAALDAYRSALAIHPHYERAQQGVRRLEPRVDGRDA